MAFSAQFQESNCISNQFSPVSPVQFYNRGYRDKYGIRYYFSNNVKNKRAFVVASGETMENLRSLRNDYEIIAWALDAGAKFSRLDLAVTQWNTFDGLVQLEDIETWCVNGLIQSNLLEGGIKEISSINDKNRLVKETLYIGDMQKRAKRGIFRAYDKGIELNIGEYMATRLELELKRDKAHSTALRLAQTNDIAGNFRAYFNVRHDDFDRLMDAGAVSTKRGKAKVRVEEREEMKKRWDWLINQVAPAMKSAIAHDRLMGLGDTNITRFLQAAGILKEQMEYAEAMVLFLHEQSTRSTLGFD
jgi:DNA relaxase NicK